MLLLFVCATGDDWDTVMYWAMDSVGPGMPRERNDSSPSSIFFVIWMFVGSFFAMQLFVGVVVAQFNTIKSVKDGSATMTEAQRQWCVLACLSSRRHLHLYAPHPLLFPPPMPTQGRHDEELATRSEGEAQTG